MPTISSDSAGGTHVRGFDEVDAAVERGVNDADGVVVVGVASGAEVHRAEGGRLELVEVKRARCPDDASPAHGLPEHINSSRVA